MSETKYQYLSGARGTLDRVEIPSHFVELYKHEFGSNRFCEIGYYYTPKNTLAGKCTFTITQQRTGADGNTQACYAAGQASCMEDDKPVQIEVSGLEDADGPYNGAVRFVIGAEGWDAGGDHIETSTNGTATTSITPNSSASFAEGKTYTVKMEASRLGINFDFPDQSCTTKITISDYCAPEQCGDEATIGGAQAIGPDEFKLCSQIKDPVAFEACTTCAGGEDGEDGIWTAIGCISREPEEIVGKLIRLGLSMGGGIALLMILSAGFTLTVSQGNPQKAGQAKEMITAAVTGLLFIIFSVTILQFIGFSVLKIPGFGGP